MKSKLIDKNTSDYPIICFLYIAHSELQRVRIKTDSKSPKK